MAFETYQANQYIKYLNQHKKEMRAIKKLVLSAPYTRTQLAKFLGINYSAFDKRVKRDTLSESDLIILLENIK